MLDSAQYGIFADYRDQIVPTANPICSRHLTLQARCSIPHFAKGEMDEREKSTVKMVGHVVIVTHAS